MSAAARPMAVLGAFREATDLAEETLTKVRAAWSRLVDAVRDLTRRAQHLLTGDGIWPSVLPFFPDEVRGAAAALDTLLVRLRPLVDTVVEALTRAAGNAVPVLTLFDTAITYGQDVVHQVAGVAADLVVGGDLDGWHGPARRAYETRVREQIGAAEAVAAEVEATARWLGEIGASNTAYLTNLGHLGADLIARFVTAAVEAGETAAADVPRYALTLARLADAVDAAVGRVAGWAQDLHNQFVARASERDDGIRDWPAAATVA